MANAAEQLSRLEREAQELTSRLRQLTSEVGSYKSAKESLQQTGAQLDSLAKTIMGLADESKSIIVKFDAIGGASLLEQLEALRSDVGSHQSAVNAGIEQVNSAVGSLQSAMTKRMDEVVSAIASARSSSRRSTTILVVVLLAVIADIALNLLSHYGLY